MRNDEKIDINLATEDTSENLSEEELATQKIREEKLEKHRIASRKYMAKYRKRLKEMKKAGTILPENLPAETKGEWL